MPWLPVLLRLGLSEPPVPAPRKEPVPGLRAGSRAASPEGGEDGGRREPVLGLRAGLRPPSCTSSEVPWVVLSGTP